MFRSELTGAVYRFRVSNVGGYREHLRSQFPKPGGLIS